MKGLQAALLAVLLIVSFSCAEDTKDPGNGPTHQVPVRPKTTLPAPKTPHPEPKETTESFKGGPTPEVPVRPKPTFPAPKTPHHEPEVTTESSKGGPTPQVPVRPKTTFPAPKTRQQHLEETTESFKGGPTPQVPVRPKTTLTAPKTQQQQLKETTENFKGGPTPQVPVRPKTTFPAPKTRQPQLEETTENFKGGPTPQVPVKPKTTFPAPKTRQPQLEKTTESFKGGPTPQVPVRPKTTFPAPKTQQPQLEETTENFKGGPTPQVPVKPKTTFPAPKTRQQQLEETTENFKGGPTPQVPVKPKTTFPAPKTRQPQLEETTENFKGGPTPPVPGRPKTTFPAPKTRQQQLEETTENFKGGPTPQVPVRPKTTFPAPKTRQPQLEETTENFKGGPTPQVPIRPKTTFPAPKTRQQQLEETTENFKGGPTPQVPVRPKTAFPAPKTPQPQLEETTENFKGGPTPQVPLQPKTTFPAPKTPQSKIGETTESFKGGENGGGKVETAAAPTPDSEVDKCPQGSTEEYDDVLGCKKEEEEQGATSPHPTPDSEQILTQAPQKVGETPPTPEPKPVTPQTLIPTAEQQETTSVSKQVCYTRWFNQDNPDSAGDFELMADILYRYPSEICSLPKNIEVQTLDGIVASATGQKFAVKQALIGFICLNVMQGKGRGCRDYRVRFVCPQDFCSGGQETVTLPGPVSTLGQLQSTPEFLVKGGETSPGPHPTEGQIQSTGQESPSVCRTVWFNQDNPFGEGDQELLVDLRKLNPQKICSVPLEIEVQTTDGIPASETGQHFAVNDPVIGFSCINAEQGKGQRCHDYQVRFTCPLSFCKGSQELSTSKPAPLTSSGPTTTLGQEQSTPQFPIKGSSLKPVTVYTPTTPEVKTEGQIEEEACKTAWFNRDTPSGMGDYELLHDLMDENPDAICLSPVGIEVQTREGVPASETGQYFAINNAAQGFACINAHQGKGTLCLDYCVRFICPKAFCKKESSTTVSITQEPTTLASLQSSTLGQVQTKEKPDITISPSAAPVCKTQWISRDNATGTGDYELVYNIRRELPKALCKNPLAIEVQTLKGIPASQTGQKFAWNDPLNGFACIHDDQGKRGLCHDYKVRFVCPESFCSGGDQKDEKKGSP